MSNRNYNVFLNAHTVSGIIICFLLFVIFFAGAFALFKDEISAWENGEQISHTANKDINFDHLFNEFDKNYHLTGRDLQFRFGMEEDHIGVFMSASKDSLAPEIGQKSHYFISHIHSAQSETYSENYTLGEFLYRLHFFAQLPTWGIYLAGFVAMLFLFTIITGVIVHWKKILPNFFTFNPKLALKRVWTEAHTALGIIGLPFQLVYAITGAYFCLSIFVLVPANLLYNNNQEKLMEDIRPGPKTEEWITKAVEPIPSYTDFVQKASSTWDEFELTGGMIKNYGGTNMKYIIAGELTDRKQFLGTGRIVEDAYTGNIIEEKNPEESAYVENIQHLLYRLHFADYGGLAVRIAYFILALITCFIIITGVLIWTEARNRKNMSDRQRLYAAGVGRTYLAICISILPVTALSFLFVQFFNGYFEIKQNAIYWFFFLTWFATFLVFRLKKDNYFTNKFCLLATAILGFLIPLSSGFVSGNWIWKSFQNNQSEILTVDILWIIIASLSLVFYFKIKPSVKEKSTAVKNPLKPIVSN